MVKISKEDKEKIIIHAKAGFPNEVCGILAGKGDEVKKVFTMANVSDSPKLCYFMESKEQLAVMKEIRNLGMEMLGIYHSHAESEAYPSAKDLELAFYPEAFYLIISLKDKNDPEVRAFNIVENKISEIEIA